MSKESIAFAREQLKLYEDRLPQAVLNRIKNPSLINSFHITYLKIGIQKYKNQLKTAKEIDI